MNFYETKSQFRILEEGEITPNNEPIRSFNMSHDMRWKEYIEFPEFDLGLYSQGQYGFQTYWAFLFRGVKFTPKIQGNWESTIINTLNRIKSTTDKEKAICEIIKESKTDEDFKVIETIIIQKNIQAEDLKDKIKILENIIAELKFVEKFKVENEKLRDKLDKIQAILISD